MKGEDNPDNHEKENVHEDLENDTTDAPQQEVNTTGQVFRKASLDRLSNPDQLDTMLVVVNNKAWIALACLVVLMILVVLWSFFGSLSVQVEGRGILSHKQGVFTVQSLTEGVVQHLFVKPGDTVEKGQLVAEIFDAQDAIRYEDAQAKVKDAQRNFDILKKEIEQESIALSNSTKATLSAKEYDLKQKEELLKIVNVDLEKRKKLAKEGLVSATSVRDTEQKQIQINIEIETIKAGIEEIKSSMVKGYRTGELRDKEQDLLREKEQLELLRSKLERSKVYSPSKGRVLELLISKGNFVTPGTSLIWFENTTNPQEAFIMNGFFPIEKGKLLSLGDRVEIAVSTVNVQEWGYLIGRISEISIHAVSPEAIIRAVHNRDVKEYLAPGSSPVIQTRIELERNSEAPSGYRWTSGKGPSVTLSTGTVGVIKATVERIKPIYYIFPVWRFKQASQQIFDETTPTKIQNTKVD